MRATLLLFGSMLLTTWAHAAAPFLEDESNTITIFKQVAPKVVFVYRIREVTSPVNSYFVPSGAGTGLLWDKEGHVITNYHLIQGTPRVAVSFGYGKAYLAKIIGVEPRRDLAVLELINTNIPDLKNFTELPLANSDALQIGQKTIAIGNPLGLERTLTTGVVSALNRKVRNQNNITIYDLIQTDASVNPGNSGGPLLNSAGQLIGLTAMNYSNDGRSAGIGFALPSNSIRLIVPQLIKFHHITPKGIGIIPLPDRIANLHGIRGLVIDQVVAGTPAAIANLRGTTRSPLGELVLGDVIVAVDDQPIHNYDDYYHQLENMRIGQTITIGFLRRGRMHTVQAKIIDRTPTASEKPAVEISSPLAVRMPLERANSRTYRDQRE